MKAFTDLLKNSPITTGVALSIAAATGVLTGVAVVMNKRKAELKATEAGQKASAVKQIFSSEVTRLADKGKAVANAIAEEIISDAILIIEEATRKMETVQPNVYSDEAELAAKNEALRNFYEDLQNVVKKQSDVSAQIKEAGGKVVSFKDAATDLLDPLLGFDQLPAGLTLDITNGTLNTKTGLIGKVGHGKSASLQDLTPNNKTEQVDGDAAEEIAEGSHDLDESGLIVSSTSPKSSSRKPPVSNVKKPAAASTESVKPAVKRRSTPRKPAVKKPAAAPEISDDADKA